MAISFIMIMDIIGTIAFAISGALLAAVLWFVMGQNGAMLCGFAVVLTIRALARHFKWNLPKLPDRKEV